MTVVDSPAPKAPDLVESPAQPLTPLPGSQHPSLLKAVLLVIVPLLPIAAEVLARQQQPEARTPYLVAYVAAIVAFALSVIPAPLRSMVRVPVSPRWPLVGGALVAAAAGFALGMRDIRGPLLVPVWAIGLVLWIAAWWRAALPRRSLHWTVALPLLVIAVGGAMRIGWLDVTPIQWDELFRTEFIQRHLDDTILANVMFDQRGDTPSSITMPGVYLRAIVYRAFGIDYVTLRLISAVFGTLDLILTYLAARVMFGRRVALVATAVLATLTVHIAFSRNALDNADSSIVWSAVALGLAIGFTRRSLTAFALIGVALAFGLQTYASAHAAFAFFLAVMLLAAVDPRTRGRWLLAASLATVGGLAVGMGPLIAAYYRNPGLFFWSSGYTDWLSTMIAAFKTSWNPLDLAPLWQHAWRAILGYGLERNLDYNYRPERAFFLALPAALLFAGVALTSLRLADWRNRLVALWFWGPTLGLSAMSAFPPDGHRSLPGFAACAVLIGLTFDRTVAGWQSLLPRGRHLTLAIAGACLAVFLGSEAWFYMGYYRYADLSPYEDKLARYTFSSNPGRHLALFNSTPVHFALFFAGDVGRRNSYDMLVQAAGQFPDTRNRPSGLTYLVAGPREGWVPLVRSVFPSAREFELRSSDQRVLRPDYFLPVRSPVMWTAFEVDPMELARYQGLTLRMVDARGKAMDLRTPSVRLPEPLPAELTYPIDVEWRGWVQHDIYGDQPDRFVSVGTIVPELWLGSVTLSPSPSVQSPSIVELPRGGVPLRAAARLYSAADTVKVQWDGFIRRDAGEVEPTVRQVPTRSGWRDFPLEQASVWPDAPRILVEWIGEDQQVIRRDYDSMIADQALNRHGPAHAARVRLSGELDVQVAGSYELRIDSDSGPVRLSIDGRQMWPPAAGAPRDKAQVGTWLTVGRHPITLERSTRDGGGAELNWRVPRSDAWSIVPPGAYAPLRWP